MYAISKRCSGAAVIASGIPQSRSLNPLNVNKFFGKLWKQSNKL